MTDARPGIDALDVRLRKASHITVLTGAGISAASGVPTFRGADGLWRQFRPEQLATAEAFHRNPRLVWEWYAWRREIIAKCRPNAAHDVLARWSQRAGGAAGRASEAGRAGGGWCRIVTQNVDDLHLRAGTRDLVRLHGSIWELACAAGCGHPRWRDERVPLSPVPPECPGCGDVARPAVVWFGESLLPEDIDSATRACACDIFLTIGTSAVVYPAAGLVHEARRRGAFTVEINPEPTAASSAVDLAIHARAEEVLPLLSGFRLAD
jgi:NAD-dependent deacetylase